MTWQFWTFIDRRSTGFRRSIFLNRLIEPSEPRCHVCVSGGESRAENLREEECSWPAAYWRGSHVRGDPRPRRSGQRYAERSNYRCGWRAAGLARLTNALQRPRLHAIQRAKRRRVGRTLVSWASHATWSAPTAHFMYWHQSTMARPWQMAIRSPQHKCPNQDNGRLQGRSATVVGPQMARSRPT